MTKLNPMKTSVRTLTQVFTVAVFLLSSSAWSNETPPPFCTQLIELKKSPRFDRLSRPIETAQFYNRRCEASESVAWLDENATLTSDANELLSAIDHSYDEGLNPQRYIIEMKFPKRLSNSKTMNPYRLNHSFGSIFF